MKKYNPNQSQKNKNIVEAVNKSKKEIHEILGISSESWNLLPTEIKNENIVKDLTEKNEIIENLKFTRGFLIKKGLELSSEKIELEKRVEDLKDRKGLSDFYKSIGDILKRLREYYYEYNRITMFNVHPDFDYGLFNKEETSRKIHIEVLKWEERMRGVLSDWEDVIENHKQLIEKNELFVCREERELFIYQYQYNSDWKTSNLIERALYKDLLKQKHEIEEKLEYEKNGRGEHESKLKSVLLAQIKKKRERIEELEIEVRDWKKKAEEAATDTGKNIQKEWKAQSEWILRKYPEKTSELAKKIGAENITLDNF